MTLKQALKKANSLSDQNLPFSELKYWALIYKKTRNPYHHFRLADSLRLCGFLKDAEKTYLSISVNSIPKKHRHIFYLYLGFLYREKGEFGKALSYYLKSLKFRSNETIPYVFIAEILKLQEKDKEAVKYLKSALAKPGDKDEVNYNLATSYIRLGQFQDALIAINNCLSINRKYPNARRIKKDIEKIISLDKIDIEI